MVDCKFTDHKGYLCLILRAAYPICSYASTVSRACRSKEESIQHITALRPLAGSLEFARIMHIL
eukprot:424128-Amphidinium_carterae.1